MMVSRGFYRVVQVQRMVLGFYRSQKDLSWAEKQSFIRRLLHVSLKMRYAAKRARARTQNTFHSILHGLGMVLGFYRSQKGGKIAELYFFLKSINFGTFAYFFIHGQYYTFGLERRRRRIKPSWYKRNNN